MYWLPSPTEAKPCSARDSKNSVLSLIKGAPGAQGTGRLGCVSFEKAQEHALLALLRYTQQASSPRFVNATLPLKPCAPAVDKLIAGSTWSTATLSSVSEPRVDDPVAHLYQSGGIGAGIPPRHSVQLAGYRIHQRYMHVKVALVKLRARSSLRFTCITD